MTLEDALREMDSMYWGCPMARSRLLQDSFGLQVNRSTLARADQRIARAYAPLYQLLIRVVRDGPVVWVDETGWKVGGHPAWLWVFTTQAVTVYLIDARRSHEVAERVLGDDFAGTLECDCFMAYDLLTDTQQKCLQHLIRRGDELAEVKAGRAIAFGREVARLLRGAIHLHHRYRDQRLSAHGYKVACGRLEKALDRLIARRIIDPDNVRFARLLQKHRQKLFRFLYEAGVTPTNAPAEQAIRPAVAVRKTSACNRQDTGAQTHSILTSMWRTAQQQGADFITWTMERLRDPAAPPPQWLADLLPLPP